MDDKLDIYMVGEHAGWTFGFFLDEPQNVWFALVVDPDGEYYSKSASRDRQQAKDLSVLLMETCRKTIPRPAGTYRAVGGVA